MRLLRTLGLMGLLTQAPVAGLECVIFDWAVPPGFWSGDGNIEPSGLLMTSTTRWAFHLSNCSVSSGECDAFGAGSLAFQDAVERTEWYSTGTVPTVTAMGNTVVYSFSIVDAFVPLGGQPRFEDLDWTISATLPATPSDSPSATELSAATIDVSIAHAVDNTFFVSSWTGTATQTVFTSCTPVPAELTIEDVTQAEGSGGGTTPFVFTVSRDVDTDEVQVTAETADGSALAGSDYTAITPTVLTFPAGGTLTQSVTVQVAADDRLEPDEGFTVELSSPVNATIADSQGAGTIQNDDVAATLSINDVEMTEGSGGGTTSFGFMVSRTHAHDPVSVDVDTADGTAVAGSDFTALSGSTLDFPADGALSLPASVTVEADDVVELDETFTVVLSAPDNATIADGTGTATIQNDDAATLSISSGEVDEGSGGGATPFTFEVTLNSAVDTAVSVSFDTADGTAEDENGDGDYGASQGLLSFDGAAGEVETVVVDVTADDRPEREETFFVDLYGLGAGGRDVTLDVARGQATILDDDDACPAFEVYRQPFDSPSSTTGHPATAGGSAAFENVVGEGGGTTSLPPGPISGLRLWGLGQDGPLPCALDPAVPFDVVFAADDAGVPGAIVAQRSDVAGQLSDVGAGVTRIDLLFAPFDGAGVSWISVQRDEVLGCAFAWLAEETIATYDDQAFVAPGLVPDDAYLCVGDPPFFDDGFESGDTSRWSAASN